MFLGVEIGLAISIGLALMIVIYESAFPHTAMLGRVGTTTIYRNIKQYTNSQVGREGGRRSAHTVGGGSCQRGGGSVIASSLHSSGDAGGFACMHTD